MNRLEALLEGLSEGALALGPGGEVLAWNRLAQRLLGSPLRGPGLHCYDVLHVLTPSGRALCGPDCGQRGCLLASQSLALGRGVLKRREGPPLPIFLLRASLLTRASGRWRVAGLLLLRPLEALPVEGVGAEALRVHTLGPFRLCLGDSLIPVERWRRHYALQVLKLLAHRGPRPTPTAVLARHLWPGVPPALGRARLKVAVSYLRQALRESGVRGPVVQTVAGGYALGGGVWVDSWAFRGLVQRGRRLEGRGRSGEALECYRRATYLYQGDYMEGESLPLYARARQALRRLHAWAVGRLASQGVASPAG